MKSAKTQILDLNEILYARKWNPFQITKIYYGRPEDGDMKKGGNFYENGSRGFQIHLGKLLGREFRFDGNVQDGSSLDTEYLRFDIPSSGQRYIIYRNKK